MGCSTSITITVVREISIGVAVAHLMKMMIEIVTDVNLPAA
jgi:hypothetical protein